MNLRDYQLEAVESVFKQFGTHDSTLLVMPTGTGKTVMFAHVIKRWTQGRVLVLAHRAELIYQAAAKIKAVTGEDPEIEMGSEYADRHGLYKKTKVVVASKDSLHPKRITRFDPDEFGLIITDEAHHAVAQTYKGPTEYFHKAKHLGVTATPDRTDEKALGKVFESVALDYEINDAVDDGWLVYPRQAMTFIEDLDFSKVKTTAGDLNGRDLADLMEQERPLHEVASATIKMAKWRKTLVFATSLVQAERLCEIINRHKPNSARWISGKTPKDVRQQTLQEYAEGGFQYLVNVGVLTEGFDDPTIECVSMARPTKSRSLYAQCIGRGTRPEPGLVDGLDTPDERKDAIRRSRKSHLLVIDFKGNSGRHKLICTADILGGNYDDEIRDEAIKLAEDAPAHVDMSAALEEAEAIVHEQRKREKAERRKRRNVIGDAKVTSRMVDPFDVLDIEPPREREWGMDKELSEKQIGLLKKNGIKADDLTYRQATKLIGEIIGRSKNGLCSYKQAKLLAKNNVDPKLTFEQASEVITQIANNGWKKPADLYIPESTEAPLESIDGIPF